MNIPERSNLVLAMLMGLVVLPAAAQVSDMPDPGQLTPPDEVESMSPVEEYFSVDRDEIGEPVSRGKTAKKNTNGTSSTMSGEETGVDDDASEVEVGIPGVDVPLQNGGDPGADLSMSVMMDPAPASITRQMSPEGDPITQEKIRLLDRSGVLGRQREISESIILMDQRLKQAEKVEEVLMALGPDTPIEISPGIYKTYKETPAAIRARIAYITLQNDLRNAMSGGSGREPLTADSNSMSDIPTTQGDVLGNSSLPVSVGSAEIPEDMQERFAVLLEEAEARFDEREEEIRRLSGVAGEGGPVMDVLGDGYNPVGISAISLREIYGAAGVYAAVIDIGGTRHEIRIDDDVAGGFSVAEIGPGHIDLVKDGESTRISL